MGFLSDSHESWEPDFNSELVDCIVGISPSLQHTQPGAWSLAHYADRISRREWFDEVIQTTVDYELPILCDRDFFHKLPAEATERESNSDDPQVVSHATEVTGGVGKNHRWRVQQTLHSAHVFMDLVGLEWPVMVGHYREINMIRELAIQEGLHPIVPPDLPTHSGEELRPRHTHGWVHLPGFLRFR